MLPIVEALTEILDSIEGYDESVLLLTGRARRGADVCRRAAFTDLVTMASSIVSSIHLPDPSESGLFNAPIRPRRRNYQLLSGNYTYALNVCARGVMTLTRHVCRSFEYGNNSTALFHFGVLIDPLSDAAQKWSSLIEVCSEQCDQGTLT